MSKKKTIKEIEASRSRKAKLERVSRDTAKHRKTEEALRGQKDLYQAVMENASFGFTLIDVNYKVVVANRIVGRYFHKPVSELIGRECFRAFKKRDSICPNCPGERAMASGQPAVVDIERVIDDGSRFSASIQAFPTIGPDGAVTGFIEIVENTTERKLAEETLQESEKRYRAIFEQAADSIVLFDAKTGVIVDFNNKAHENLDYSSEQFQKLKISDIDASESEQEVAKHIEKIVREGADTFETKQRTKSGEIRDILVNAKVISTGGRDLVQAIWRDITERKKAEEVLRISERYLAEAQKIAHVGNWRWEIIPDEVYWSDEAYRLFGVEPGEPVDYVRYLSIVLPEDRDFVMKEVQDALDGTKPYENEHRIVRNGEVRIHHTKGTVSWDEQGRPIRLFGVVQDITERKKAEEELYRAHQSWENIFQALGQPSFILDPQHKVLEANRAAVKAIGKPIEQIIGRKCYELLHRKESPPQDCPMEKMLLSNRLETVEMEMEVLGGVYLVSCTPVPDRSGRIEKVIHIATDITERKRAEEKLRNYQMQLKSLASELTLAEERERRRIAVKLHDQIAQSLVISKITLDTLRSSKPSQDTIKELDEISDSLYQTIRDIRSLTFDLSFPILYELGFEAAVAAWLVEQIQEKYGITSELEDDEQPKPLDDDVRVLLFRDVRELLINVVKHANAKKIKVSIRKAGSWIHVSVEDDGVGFDVSKVVSSPTGTHGFGLFSIRERLEQLGGRLEIDSKPGYGTKATLTAPLKQQNAKGRQK